MRILLPPSETKAHGGTGPPLAFDALGFPELNETRMRIADALIRLARHPARARTALGLSARQDHEITRNAHLLASATMPALSRYTGVLYGALGADALTPARRRRAHETIVICSALFGALRAGDPIPAYRLSASASLPRLGPLTAVWRVVLPAAIDDDLVLDLRSGAYVALAPVPDAVTVRVVTTDGRSVSHHNKAAKGALARALVTARRAPTTLDAAVRAARTGGLDVRRSGERTLELTVPAGVAAPHH